VLISVADLPRALPHDRANALAAAAVALAAGATPEGCRCALARTPLLPHRVSLVGESGGVRWYDDSKATTPASVLAAVAGFPSVVLIAGGRNKGLDLTALVATVPPVRAVVAIGEATAELQATFANLVPVTAAVSMDAAVHAAAGVARDGDAVLLSPGCASFDWYPSYAARGDHFASIVTRSLTAREREC
jgi:UDP-N-acetylmuramoylalanine--D-glutamate ligase